MFDSKIKNIFMAKKKKNYREKANSTICKYKISDCKSENEFE